MNKFIITYILRRLSEASTVRGLVLFVGSVAGIAFTDAQTNNLVWIVLGVVGMIGTFVPDKMAQYNSRQSDVAKTDSLRRKTDPEVTAETSLTPPGYVEPEHNDAIDGVGFGEK